jgi:Recombination directionality factor-like
VSILDLQRSIAEAGRIRIGQQVPTSNGRTRPEKLDTFRLTSPDKRRIEEAAGLFGGTVTPWKAPAGEQWQVVTTSAEIDVIVPPSAMAFSQHLELWSAGGCQRRCDGVTEALSQQPCLCDPEQRECDYHTRLSVMIRDLPGLALWRLDTQGWYAARELAGAVEILTLAAGRGVMIPARLLLEQRSVKRPGKDGKPQTLRFAVPRLDLGITPGELLLAGGPPTGVPLAALTDGAPPERRLTPVPQIEGPRPTIAEQSAPPPDRPARRNAAPEIPASGRRRNAAVPGDAGYWRARAFAEGAERGIDADRMRGLAAMHLNLPAEGFSMSALDEVAWERVHGMIVGFPTVASGPEEAPPPREVPGEAVRAAAAPAVFSQPSEATPTVSAGLSLEAFRELCFKGGKSTVAIAKAIECVPGDVGKRVLAMTHVERGVLADELKLEWRTS